MIQPINNPVKLNFTDSQDNIIPKTTPETPNRQLTRYSILSLLYEISLVTIATFPLILFCVDEFVNESNI